MLRAFSTIVKISFWWPKPDVSWKNALQYIHVSQGQLNLEELQNWLKPSKKKSECFVQNVLVHAEYSRTLILIV